MMDKLGMIYRDSDSDTYAPSEMQLMPEIPSDGDDDEQRFNQNTSITVVNSNTSN